MHKAKKKKNYRKNLRYIDLFLVVAVQTQPRQHMKSIFLNSDISRKETVHKHPSDTKFN
jgi:hypothetical protein